MPGFPKKDRQRIIDGYLAATGRNLFVPGEFIDWLEGQPDHEAYPWFFGKDDAEAAREYRVMLARQMASGLRIVVQASDPQQAEVRGITVREYPAYVSPVGHRKMGGGYQTFDPSDVAQVEELRRQGITSLKTWLARYSGVFEEEARAVFAIVQAHEEKRSA